MNSSIQKIAIIRRNGFGDVLCTLPLILRCKELMPSAQVSLFVEKKVFCLAPYLEGPDEVLELPSSGNKYLDLFKLAWRERKKSFDLAISAKTTPMKLMNLSLCALQARLRSAYVGNRWHDVLINHPTPYQKQNSFHQALQAIHLIDPEMKNLPKRLFPTLKPMQKKRLFAKKTLFLSVSNNRIGSTLAVNYLANLLNHLAEEHIFAVAISALSQDLSRAQELSSLLQMEHKIFVTEPFADFMSLLYSSDAIFACDGGIVHMAAALQKPSVCLFGGVKVSQWGPLNEKAKVLFHPVHVIDIPKEEIVHALHDLLGNLKND